MRMQVADPSILSGVFNRFSRMIHSGYILVFIVTLQRICYLAIPFTFIFIVRDGIMTTVLCFKHATLGRFTDMAIWLGFDL